MKTPDTTIRKVGGIYKWELRDSWDNRTIDANQVIEYKHKRETVIDSKIFLKQQFDVRTKFEYKQTQSANLSVKSIGNVSSQADWMFHAEAAYSLVKSSETNRTFTETVETNRTITIAKNCRAAMYQLAYYMDGVKYPTDVYALTNGSKPGSDVTVEITFACQNNLLGLDDLLVQLSEIRPHVANIQEWKEIRQCITDHQDASEEDAFQALVTKLGSTKPFSDNRDEWDRIRQVCSNMLSKWSTTPNKTLLLKILLSQFVDTQPYTHNKEEWAAIRKTSQNILNALREVHVTTTTAPVA